MDSARVARNEITHRRINEGIERGRKTRDGLTGFLCECGQVGCNRVVELTLDEYDRLRAQPRWFVVCDGHGCEHDEVRARHERYVVVEKVGAAGAYAERTDPRGS